MPVLGKCPGRGNGNLFSILAWRTPGTEKPGGLHTFHEVAESDMTEQLTLSLFHVPCKVSLLCTLIKI